MKVSRTKFCSTRHRRLPYALPAAIATATGFESRAAEIHSNAPDAPLVYAFGRTNIPMMGQVFTLDRAQTLESWSVAGLGELAFLRRRRSLAQTH